MRTGVFSQNRGMDATTPLYQQMKAAIIARIEDGTYRPGDRLPAEPDIAEQFGVSRMTANKAILSLVTEGWLTRKRKAGTIVADRRAATDQPFSPIVMAHYESMPQEDSYFQGLFWGLHSNLSAQGIELRTVMQDGLHLPKTIHSMDVDPLIVIGTPRYMLEDLIDFAQSGRRIVLIGCSFQGYGMVSVDSDNFYGASLAVKHLADSGHTGIAFVGGQPLDTNTVDRQRGFRAAITGRGLEYREDWSIVSEGPLDDYDKRAKEQVAEMLSKEDRPTAIFAGGSFVAMSVINIANSIGLRVPDDLSVVGYDDPPFVQHLNPPLTTIQQPLALMAKKAAELVVSPFLFGDINREIYTFDPEIVVRASTSPLIT